MKLEQLMQSLQSSMARMTLLDDEQSLVTFSRLESRAMDLAGRFDHTGPAPVPPLEKRLAALRNFLAKEDLSQTEWRLVFAGLADAIPKPPVLERDAEFARVHAELQQRIANQRLSRRDWLAMCYSYFACSAEKPESNRHWLNLRDLISAGFAAVRQRAAREKAWMRVVEQHRVLFTDQAGNVLGEQLFRGEISDLSALQVIAQIPDSSWLWQRIFAVITVRIGQLGDRELLERLPGLLELGKRFPLYRDTVLAACLTRYYQSNYRQHSLELLKQHTLDAWGSPQLRSRQNAWLQHVSEPICRMVMSWFARDDIELFFKLLQGESGVDQARLFYWLRFADQMTYTRIVMGNDAWYARDPDFVEFRKNNTGRLGRLAGGTSSNNAVIMQIGDYLFVEFSATGNACYVYKASKAPFKPEQEQLNLNYELKQQGTAVERLHHRGAPSRPNVVDGWLLKFDEALQRLGIISTDSPQHRQAQRLQSELDGALGAAGYRIKDLRQKGGALHVFLESPASVTQRAALMQLGFKEKVASNAREFWRN